MEIPRQRRDLKAKLLEGQYEAKLEFPGGCGGAKQKTFRGGSMDIFWNYTMHIYHLTRFILCIFIPCSGKQTNILFDFHCVAVILVSFVAILNELKKAFPLTRSLCN